MHIVVCTEVLAQNQKLPSTAMSMGSVPFKQNKRGHSTKTKQAYEAIRVRFGISAPRTLPVSQAAQGSSSAPLGTSIPTPWGRSRRGMVRFLRPKELGLNRAHKNMSVS